jgi:hypothetical protein
MEASMKFSVMILSLILSSSVFSSSILEGLKFENVPSASNHISNVVPHESELPVVIMITEDTCIKERGAAVSALTKLGAKIISSDGCIVTVSDETESQTGPNKGHVMVETSYTLRFI